jgi:hypothetical protein
VFHEPDEGDPYIESSIPPTVIEAYDEELRSIIRQVPLELGETALEGLPT